MLKGCAFGAVAPHPSFRFFPDVSGAVSATGSLGGGGGGIKSELGGGGGGISELSGGGGGGGRSMVLVVVP